MFLRAKIRLFLSLAIVLSEINVAFFIIYNKVYDVFVIDENQERLKRCIKTENFF